MFRDCAAGSISPSHCSALVNYAATERSVLTHLIDTVCFWLICFTFGVINCQKDYLADLPLAIVLLAAGLGGMLVYRTGLNFAERMPAA